MSPADVPAATARILMLAATPDHHPAALRDALAEFDDIPTATHLATTLATHIAGKLPWTPLVFDLDQPAQMLAFAMARHATANGSLYLADFLDDLGPTELAAVCIALLRMWATACDEAAKTAIREIHARGWDTTPPVRPSKAPLSPQNGSNARGSAPTAPDAAQDGSNA